MMKRFKNYLVSYMETKPDSQDIICRDRMNLMMYSPYDNHDMACFENQQNQTRGNSYSGWGCKSKTEFQWRAKQIEELDSRIYNLRMTTNQHTMLVGTQSSLYVYNCQNGIRKIKQFQPHNITWTISDIDISDDSTFAISCSLNPRVSLYDLENTKVLQEFNLSNNPNDQDEGFGHGFRFYSCKMSSDKCALIGGSGLYTQNQSLIQYFDITKNKVTHTIKAHRNDINTICFVKGEQSSVFLSGSDDALIKVWDIRALGVNKKAVGILYGHMSGLTNIDTRNDGVYVCSNSKDQSLKLWDLRQMTTDDLPIKILRFDYNYDIPNRAQMTGFDKLDKSIHTNNSVCSFRSHKIYQTLIRCHFSPKLTTNSDYIISASACGKVFIYSMHNPEQPPIIIQNKTQPINPDPILDNIKIQKPTQMVDDNDDWESDSGNNYNNNNNNNNNDNSDDDDEVHGVNGGHIVRDVVWNDNSIIVGDFASNLKEFKPL